MRRAEGGNAVGRIAELLFEILKELKIANRHLEELTSKQYQARRNPMMKE